MRRTIRPAPRHAGVRLAGWPSSKRGGQPGAHGAPRRSHLGIVQVPVVKGLHSTRQDLRRSFQQLSRPTRQQHVRELSLVPALLRPGRQPGRQCPCHRGGGLGCDPRVFHQAQSFLQAQRGSSRRRKLEGNDVDFAVVEPHLMKSRGECIAVPVTPGKSMQRRAMPATQPACQKTPARRIPGAFLPHFHQSHPGILPPSPSSLSHPTTKHIHALTHPVLCVFWLEALGQAVGRLDEQKLAVIVPHPADRSG